MVLLIDNYDSFTYNLYQYFRMLGCEVEVVRNDALTVSGIEDLNPRMIVLSPGPGSPADSGVCVDVVKAFSGRIPIMGICLGMQVIASAYGAEIREAANPMHGKNSMISHFGKGMFRGLKNPLRVTRYHSLVVDNNSLSKDFEVTAETLEGEIMGIRHRCLLIEGVQFHPEALMTEMGLEMLGNFIEEFSYPKEASC